MLGQLYWTQQIEVAMLNNGLKDYLDQSQEELTNVILLIRGKLSKQNRITLGNCYFKLSINKTVFYTNLIIPLVEALVTLDVHGKDVLSELVKKDVSNKSDFNWLCQLRYYWRVFSNFTHD